jgi:hypothetical protein
MAERNGWDAEARDDRVVLRCADMLRDARALHLAKARWKRYALIRCALENAGPAEVAIHAGRSTLEAGGSEYSTEPRDVVIRRCSEFTWDFLAYLILDFGWITGIFDLLCLATGRLFNRRLRKKLASIADGDAAVAPGGRWEGILAFQKVPRGGKGTVVLRYTPRGEGERTIRATLAEITAR